MSDCLELQAEEEEALLSIYYGDPAFKQVSQNAYQYKCGSDGDANSFILEVSWPSTYPTEKPVVNFDIFYNNHVPSTVKDYMKSQLYEKAEQYLGLAVTYTLFELAKDNITKWLKEKPIVQNAHTLVDHVAKLEISESSQKNVVKKEHLTKAQKRKQWDRGQGNEKPRGWNWVDIVKHLSQKGSQNNN